jgi:hypothetical protein
MRSTHLGQCLVTSPRLGVDAHPGCSAARFGSASVPGNVTPIVPTGTSEHPKRPFFEFEGVVVFHTVSETHCRQYGFVIDRQGADVVREHLLQLGARIDFCHASRLQPFFWIRNIPKVPATHRYSYRTF